ncbi:hypothetical protein [Denitrobaculum tricleocarpae]|uniref:Uncharacterized protein n=1 Tax=Denitrobaculum tricleocarpae TaxID=2591009 RepID=A0A545SXZ5_9PROT|nr:hypothetical protein [Denitrobaculum tricleocarpae]TQV69836.1 hypothetical protein FKG95_28575 [Denitrobaculum tricleocarpae]
MRNFGQISCFLAVSLMIGSASGAATAAYATSADTGLAPGSVQLAATAEEKAKERAEKKRIKEEEKRIKAEKRAEKKRLKAEERAAKKKAAAEKKVEKALKDIEKNLSKLEGAVDESIPLVSFTSPVSRQVSSAIKGADRALKNLAKADPEYDLTEINERYEPLKAFFENKAAETESPAAQSIRSMVFDLKFLERDAEGGAVRTFNPSPVNEFVSEGEFKEQTVARHLTEAMNLDPEYDFTQLLERFDPYARNFVEGTGQLLEHMDGYKTQQEIAQAITNANVLGMHYDNFRLLIDGRMAEFTLNEVRIERAKADNATLMELIAAVEKNIPLLQQEAQTITYYNTQVFEAELGNIHQALEAASRHELVAYDKIDTSCQAAIAGKVVFGSDHLTFECDPSSFITEYIIGDKLYMRAGFEDIPANAYIVARDHELTLGVPNGITVKAVYKLDGEELFAFYPKHSETTQNIEAELITTYPPSTNSAYHWNLRDVFFAMMDAGKEQAVLDIELYAFNRDDRVDESLKDGPLIAKGSLKLDASTDAAQTYLLQGLVGVTPPGPLHDAFASNAARAMARSEIAYDVLHVTSKEMTVVKNILGIPLKKVIATTVAQKHADNSCTVYVQWMKQVFDGTGYAGGLSLDRKEPDHTVHCKAVEQYL